jgi:hypothetical protein
VGRGAQIRKTEKADIPLNSIFSLLENKNLKGNGQGERAQSQLPEIYCQGLLFVGWLVFVIF